MLKSCQSLTPKNAPQRTAFVISDANGETGVAGDEFANLSQRNEDYGANGLE